MKKFRKILFLCFVTLLISLQSMAQSEKVAWLSFEELASAYARSPRPIIIDVYTNWCGWCKIMDKKTYGNGSVASYINEHYYAVKMNAETKKDIVYNGKTYSYNQKYRANDLAVLLTYGRLEFPHTILLSALNAQPAPFSGYQKPAQMEGPLKFFGEGAFKNETYMDFVRTLKKEWK